MSRRRMMCDKTTTDIVLPEGYTRLNYIENNGNAIICSSVNLDNDVGVKIKFQLTFNNKIGYLLGAYNVGKGRFCPLFYDSQFNSGALAYTPTMEFVEKKYADFDMDIHELEFNVDEERSVKWEGVKIDTLGTFVLYSGLEDPIYIFGRFLRGLGDNFNPNIIHARIYSCSLYKGGIIAQNFIPARNDKGVVGFWDSVSGSFFTSINQHSFIGG